MGLNLGLTQLANIESVDIFAGLHSSMQISNIVIAAGQNLSRGACLGKKTLVIVDTVTLQANAGNTGNGLLVFETPPTGEGVKPGVYKVTFIEAGVDSGVFQVKDPDGIIIGNGTVGALFDIGVRFTISDGTVDFVVGDSFDITVTFNPSYGKYYLWNPTANDGTEVLAGILGCDVDASSEDGKGFMYVHGEFLASALTPPGIAPGVYNNGLIVIKEDIA